MRTHEVPQPQWKLITIPIPANRTSRPTGANTRSPTNAACLAIIAISAGSDERSAFSARMVSVRPPPTHRTAPVTWTHLKKAYQFEANTLVLKRQTSTQGTTARTHTET